MVKVGAADSGLFGGRRRWRGFLGSKATSRRRLVHLPAEDGSAVVSYLLVSLLVIVLVVGVLQLAVVQYVRNVLIDAASTGARYAAQAGNTLPAGQQRCQDIIEASVGTRFSQNVTARYLDQTPAGVTQVLVEVEAPLPVFGMWSLGLRYHIQGHGLVEGEPGG